MFLLHLHTRDAWWTVNEVAAVEADISGVMERLIFSQVFSKKRSFFAQHFFSASLMNGFQVKTENHFCFLLMVPASHPCHVLTCCVAAPSVKRLGMIIDLHKKCMNTLCFMSHERFPIFFPIVWTLSVAWVTKICFDTCGNWSFF